MQLVHFALQSRKKEKKRKEKAHKQQKAPHINYGKGAPATWEEKPLHQKRKGGVSEDQEGCKQTS